MFFLYIIKQSNIIYNNFIPLTVFLPQTGSLFVVFFSLLRDMSTQNQVYMQIYFDYENVYFQ